MNAADLPDAIEALRKAHAIDPSSLDIAVELGRALRADYRVYESLALLLKTVEAHPTDHDARAQLALSLVDSGQPDKAIADLERLTAEAEERADFWIARARALVKLGRYRDALAILDVILKDHPREVMAMLAAAEANWALVRPAKWLPLVVRAWEVDQENEQVQLWMARSQEVADEAKRQEHCLLRALEIQPRTYEARVSLGVLLWKRGDLEAAHTLLWDAAQQAPWDGLTEGMLIHFSVETGREVPAASMAAAERSAQDLPYGRLAFYLGRMHVAVTHDYDQALRLLAIDADRLPENVDTWMLLAHAHMFRGDEQAALPEFQHVIDLCPQDGEAWRGLATAKQNLGDTDGAIEAYKRAVQLLPASAAAHYGLGIALLDSGESSAAVAEFSRAVDLDPNNVTFRAALEEARAAAV